MELDERAAKIVLDGYWSPKGWRQTPAIEPGDFEHAVAHGLMFAPISLTHDQKVARAIAARDAVTKEEVADAFVASLRLPRLDLRSALGSYAVARHLRRHPFDHLAHGSACGVCGEYATDRLDQNILSFERLKWGGVRHLHPSYIGFDLERFQKFARPPATSDDRAALIDVLKVARAMPPSSRLSDLVRALAPLFASNVAERRVLIGILGFCGILQDPSKPGFLDGFVPNSMRAETRHSKDDWPYPVQWWTGAHGVDERAVEYWFPFAGGA